MSDYLEKEDKKQLSKLQSEFASTNPLVQKVISQLGKIGVNSNICVYFLLMVVGLLVLFLLYLLK